MSKFSAKVEYALLAALDLAAQYEPEKPVAVSAIAARTGTPSGYLVQILLALKRAALVRSARGPRGGYWLMCPPRLISLAQIVEAVESSRPGDRARSAARPGRKAIDELAQTLEKDRRAFLAGISLAEFLRQVQGND